MIASRLPILNCKLLFKMEVSQLIGWGNKEMDSTIDHLKDELLKIRAGKANPSMLKGIMVEYYGNPTDLSQVSNISTPDSRTIAIQPWEKNLLGNIEQAIFAANLGITPMNDGEFIRITIPPLTEERRKGLVKQAKGLSEDTKVSLRTTRQKMMDFIKKEVKEGYPEDAGKKMEKQIQDVTNAYGNKVDKLLEAKTEDIMKV